VRRGPIEGESGARGGRGMGTCDVDGASVDWRRTQATWVFGLRGGVTRGVKGDTGKRRGVGDR
jgi:hypothetical protein